LVFGGTIYTHLQVKGCVVVLRKCPSCKDLVGAESDVCPRCGASFRGAMLRRVMFWVILMGAGLWAVGHYVIRVV
jgi:hypothetical protein